MVELVEIFERVANVAKKVEALGHILADAEGLAYSELDVCQVKLSEVPELKVVLKLSRSVRDTLLGKLLAQKGEYDATLYSARLETYTHRNDRWVELSVNVGGRPYEVKIPERGMVTVRLIDLLALSLLEEGEWQEIFKHLEEKETELRELREKLAAALAALKVVLS